MSTTAAPNQKADERYKNKKQKYYNKNKNSTFTKRSANIKVKDTVYIMDGCI